MASPTAGWRVSYTPGDWLVLTGPSTLMVVQPPPELTPLRVAALWEDVAAAGSVDALIQVLGQHGLQAIPDLGAFFFNDAAVHAVARGRVRVLDAATSETAVSGRGVVTWRQEGLGTPRQLRIDMQQPTHEHAPRLPLVTGVVMASTIHLGTERGDGSTSLPQPAGRPAPARVRSTTGSVADLDAAVVVGRSPDAARGPLGAHLMRVHSPGGDISRSHLLITPREGAVVVTDLDSTNGTTIIASGEEPFVLQDGRSVRVEVGTVLELGDDVSLRIEPPAD